MCLATYLGIWSGQAAMFLPMDSYKTSSCNFFTRCSLKMEVSEIYFFCMVATQNDHPSSEKHVLGRICVFPALLGGLVQEADPLRGRVVEGNGVRLFQKSFCRHWERFG